MIRGARTFFSVAVGTLVMGCGGSPELALDELTLQEAEELAAATMFATFDVTSVVPPRPSGLPTTGDPAVGWALDFEAEVRCPVEGRVALAVEALVRTDGGAEEVDYRLTQIHQECGVDRQSEDLVTVSGSPRSTARVRVSHDSIGRVSWSGTSAGELTWYRGERAGRCTFDVTFTGRSDETDRAATVQGSMCGQPMNHTIALR